LRPVRFTFSDSRFIAHSPRTLIATPAEIALAWLLAQKLLIASSVERSSGTHTLGQWPEFVAKGLRKWLADTGTKALYFEPGSP
jgi:hypothetical protein